MIDERDIWGSAKILINRYGEEAAIEAAMRADKFMAEGNLGGRAVSSVADWLSTGQCETSRARLPA